MILGEFFFLKLYMLKRLDRSGKFPRVQVVGFDGNGGLIHSPPDVKCELSRIEKVSQ